MALFIDNATNPMGIAPQGKRPIAPSDISQPDVTIERARKRVRDNTADNLKDPCVAQIGGSSVFWITRESALLSMVDCHEHQYRNRKRLMRIPVCVSGSGKRSFPKMYPGIVSRFAGDASYECLGQLQRAHVFTWPVKANEIGLWPVEHNPIFAEFGYPSYILRSMDYSLLHIFSKYIRDNGPVLLHVYFEDLPFLYNRGDCPNMWSVRVKQWVSLSMVPLLYIEGLYMTLTIPGLDTKRTQVPDVELVPIHLNPLTEKEIEKIVNHTMIRSLGVEVPLATLIRNHRGKIRGVHKISDDEDVLAAFVRCLYEFSSGKPKIVRDVLLSTDWAMDRSKHQLQHDIYKALDSDCENIIEVYRGLRNKIDPFTIHTLHLSLDDNKNVVMIPPATRSVLDSVDGDLDHFVRSLAGRGIYHTELRPLVILILRIIEQVFMERLFYTSELMRGFIPISSAMGREELSTGIGGRCTISRFRDFVDEAKKSRSSTFILPESEGPDFYIFVPREDGVVWLVAVVVYPPLSHTKIWEGLQELVGICNDKKCIPEKLWVWWCDPLPKATCIDQEPREKSILVHSSFMNLPLEIIWMNFENHRNLHDLFASVSTEPHEILNLINEIYNQSL